MSGNNGSSYNEGIAIIGIGCIYPKAVGKDRFWNNIINSVNGIIEVPKDRWDADLYFDPDKSAPDKTYSKLGGFTDNIDTKSISIKYKIPPRTVEAMDRAQAYALIAAGEALEDSGYAQKEFNRDRTAVIIGNAMGGDQEDYTNLRVFQPFINAELEKSAAFSSLDSGTRKSVLMEFEASLKKRLPEVNEDSMPGELSNVIAGRIANTFNLRGQNCTVDAACASSLAATAEAMKGLRMHDFDMVVCGGSDFMMGPGPYVKFSKIGALSPDGSRPFDAKANGFIMGEGVGIYILKRVSDARRDGDKIYAIVRSIGASSDGKGKGITAPNPKGQVLAVERAFQAAGYGPETVQLVEAHGTSTSVGDRVEVESLIEAWKNAPVANGSIGLGSVKSMIGHLKAAAGSASLIKMSLALHNKIMPPSINFRDPNPDIQFGRIPFRVVTGPEEWRKGANGNPRRANVSAFGFGGTNFHVALEEDAGTNGMPEETRKYYSMDRGIPTAGAGSAAKSDNSATANKSEEMDIHMKTEQRDVRYDLSAVERKKIEAETIVIGGDSREDVIKKIEALKAQVKSKLQGDGYSIRLFELAGSVNPTSIKKDVIAAFSAESMDDLLSKLDTAAVAINEPKKWLLLANKGIFFGENLNSKRKEAGKLALLFPGQGSQYVNMLKDLYNKYEVVRETFDLADTIMKELIGETLTGIFFVRDDASESEKKEAEAKLRRTEITQPAILTVDYALYRLLQSFGIKPQVVIGHSLGEYGALIASGVLSFKDALVSVAARGKEIASLKVEDVGKMASVAADYKIIEEVLKGIDGYVIPANKNCHAQTVIGGNSKPVEQAIEIFSKKGIEAREIPVSHAFHSNIVALACEPYRRVLERLQFNKPGIDIIANIDAEYYPKSDGYREKIIEILVKHIASPVEFVKQIERMYADGVRMFIEAGPKKTLTSFVQNVADKRPHFAVSTNHPKRGGTFSFNDALAAAVAWGMDLNWNGVDQDGKQRESMEWRYRDEFIGRTASSSGPAKPHMQGHEIKAPAPRPVLPDAASIAGERLSFNRGDEGVLTAGFHEKQQQIVKNVLEEYSRQSEALMRKELEHADYYKQMIERYNLNFDRIMISGISVGLPGSRFDVFENSFDRVLNGENMIDSLPKTAMEQILGNNVVRLVKGDGDAHFEAIGDLSQVVKLAGQMGRFDFEKDYGVDNDYAESLDITTKLAIAAGVRALHDAGIPLVRFYKDTTIGGILPTHWGLPEEMSDDTGVIFSSAFPGYDNMIHDLSKNFAYKYGAKAKAELVNLYLSIIERVKDEHIRGELTDWYTKNYSILREGGEENVYQFNRKFIFRMLAMGHAQFAQYIKAKGPNVQMNTACSSTVTAIGMAEDWIRTGRAKRVVVVGGDAATSDMMGQWILSAFLALGAVTTEGDYRNAAIPFDKRRNGMIAGMGAVGLVIEAESELKKRGMHGIAEVVATEFQNSAFHVTRLDPQHISSVMDRLITKAERIMGVRREEIADKTIFMSHETYTPARGGSASAEVESLRNTFGDKYKDILVTNTKGFTGHPMGAGIEDAIIVKTLQTGKVPPIANYKEPDPELGDLNLSKGGVYKERIYAIRLGAGFGSQIGMSFLRLESRAENRVVDQPAYQKWLSDVSGFEDPQLEVVDHKLRIKDDIEQVRNNRKKIADPVKQARPAETVSAEPVKAQAVQTSNTDDVIKARVRAIVAEKTGYPEDMIEFDLDMESDLGIDTVKQAEMFGLIRESYKIPQQEGLKIKDFPTLNHVVQFVLDRAPGVPKQAPVIATASQERPKAPQGGNGADDMIRQRVRAIVAEKTGYPEDMIEFDLDMESDLGIDTVKQAEMFGMIRESYKIPQQEGLKIKDFPTLNHVIQFVKDKASGLPKQYPAIASVSAESPQPAKGGNGADDMIRQRVRAIVAEKTGYPEDMIEFDLDMESDLGIDTVKQAEMFGMIRESYKIPQQEGLKIKDFPTLNHVIQFVKDRAPGMSKQEPTVASATMESPQPARGGNGADDMIRQRVRTIVAEKTGYPEDMIEFDLDMESDLGIDTVKQAEMFGMIRESYNIPQQEGLKIKDFPTLNHVVNFVKSKSPDYNAIAHNAGMVSASISAPHDSDVPAAEVKETRIKRMVVEVIEDPFNKNEAAQIDLNNASILITDDGRGIAKALEKIFKEKGASVELIDHSKLADKDTLQAEIGRIKGIMKPSGIVHLAPVESYKPVADMSIDEWRAAAFRRIKSLFIIAKAFQADLVENSRSSGAFLVSLTGMGGTFGIESFEAADPLSGGVVGLTKAINKELNGVLVKTIDLSLVQKALSIAKKIVKEVQLGGSRVEIGFVGEKRMVTQVVNRAVDSTKEPRNNIKPGSVFVVTGGGYGITAEIAKDLAANLKVRLALVSIEKLPENVAEIASMDEKAFNAFKDKVVSELKASNDRITPVMIQKEVTKYTTAVDIYKNIHEMKSLGAPDVEYYSCDVTDSVKVSDLLAKIRARFGAINGIIHGAGLEQSKLMEDKKYEDFCRVFDVKADGAFNLVELTKEDDVRYFVPFASVAGRFGNIGQTDYSAANDLLNKYAQLLNRRFAERGMKAVSMNWTGWKDVGMATRGSLVKIFEEGGVDMIPKVIGVTKVREDLLYGSEGEVVIAGSLGQIDCDGIIVGDRTREFMAASHEIKSNREQYPLIDELVELKPGEKIVVRKKLDIEVDLYLKDHAVGGVPYFPAVMGIETFCEAAFLLCPDRSVWSMKNVAFKYPIKLLKNAPVEITATLEVSGDEDGKRAVSARIESEFFTKDGVKLGDRRLHFQADILLSENTAARQDMSENGLVSGVLNGRKADADVTISEKEIYKRFFHGPKFQVHGGVIKIKDDMIVGKVAANGSTLFSTVKKPRFIANPMLLEAALQNAGIYSMVKANISSLPDSIGEISFTQVPEDAGELFIWAQCLGNADNRTAYNAQIVDKQGRIYSDLKDYKMITTGELGKNERFQ